MSSDREPRWMIWQHVPEVKVWEGVALSIGIEPTTVRHSSTSWMANAHLFDESDEFKGRLLVATRNLTAGGGLEPTSIKMGDPPNATVVLAAFANWAVKLRWPVPAEFEQLAADATPVKTSPPVAKPEPSGDLKTRERGTLLKLVLGMALAGYSYKPAASRDTVVNEIVADLARYGISLSDDTVRRWLKTALDEVTWHNPNSDD